VHYWWGDAQSKNIFELAVCTVFESHLYTNDAKGRMLELYLLEVLRDMWKDQKPKMELKAHKIDQHGDAVRNRTDLHHLHFEHDKVRFIEFGGGTVPPQGSFPRSTSAFLIPTRINYPEFDLLYWDAVHQKLIAFSITVGLTGHGFDFSDALKTMWRDWINMQDPRVLDAYNNAAANKVQAARTAATNLGLAFEMEYVWIAPDDQKAPPECRPASGHSQHVFILPFSALIPMGFKLVTKLNLR
jgi:hypothetical protein